jgi:Mrp family chromosome partitioning ATPase
VLVYITPGDCRLTNCSFHFFPIFSSSPPCRLKGTDWKELDILILDLPPGTGDIQLQVCQDIQLSGAVAVTTPSRLATVDTKKGIDMFTSLGVPTLAVVENMSYFTVR